MSRKLSRKLLPTIALLFLLTVPASAFAWGNAVHTWLADNLGRRQGVSNFQELYGSTLPDQYNFIFDPAGFYLAWLSHNDYQSVIDAAWTCRLEAVAFAYASHNDLWGADSTAHASGRTTPGIGYVILKAAVLQPELVAPIVGVLADAGVPDLEAQAYAESLSPLLAHLLIESGVDLLVKEKLDRSIGAKMMVGARIRTPDVPALMAAAYADGLAVYSGMTPEQAAGYLMAVEEANRDQMLQYGKAYAGSRAKALRYMAGLGAAVGSAYLTAATGYSVSVPPELAAAFTLRAEEIVSADCLEELLATLDYLAGALEANGVETCGPPVR